MTEPRTREIQLTAKQLVFVFMSTVLVAVVIFLLGVWVGRGIGVDVPAWARDATDVETGTLKSTPPAVNGPAPTKPPADPPPFDYPKRLLDGKASTTSPAPSGQSAPDAQAQTPPPASAPPPAPATPPPSAPPTGKPAAAGAEAWVVQVGAYSNKANADKVASQFRAKGYVVSVTPGPTFKVWIGPFPQKPAADQVAYRLRKEGREVSVIPSR